MKTIEKINANNNEWNKEICPCCNEKLIDYDNYPFCSHDCRKIYYE